MSSIDESYRSLMKVVSIRNSRKEKIQVFYDFLEMSAIHISNRALSGCQPEGIRNMERIAKSYNSDEIAFLFSKLAELQKLIASYVDQGEIRDILGRLLEMMELTDKGQDFSTEDVTRLMVKLNSEWQEELLQRKYFTFYDCAAGSGAFALAVAEDMMQKNLPYWSKMVACLVELDRVCVHMAYIQLSMYGITGVVVHGNTLTQEEFDRWYTPMYIRGRWIWRQPFHLNEQLQNPYDEHLKMVSTPAEYHALRFLRWYS